MTREEAIRRIKSWNLDSDDMEVLSVVIPELNESEDERIRKKCIELIKRVIPSGNSHSQESKEILDCIAYLEKQKEQKPSHKFNVGDTIHCKYDDREFTIKSVDLTNMVYKYTKEGCGNDIAYADEDFELVEQKPTECLKAERDGWYVCIKDYYCGGKKQCAVGNLVQAKGGMYMMGEENISEWFRKAYYEEVRDAFEPNADTNIPEQPTEWSDTDNIGWDEAFACVTRAEKAAKSEEELQNAVTAEKWLKEIKFKYYVHPVKQEWSEEDKKRIKQLIYDTEAIRAGYEMKKKQLGKCFNEMLIKDCDEQIAWLKSLPFKLKKKNEDVAKLCSNEWSEEEKKIIGNIHHLIFEHAFENGGVDVNGDYCKDVYQEMDDFLKSLCPQPKPEWSEEDKKLIDNVINSLCCYQNTLSDYQKEIVGEEIQKLKSLKPQPKQEWSKEDERILKGIIGLIDHNQHYGVGNKEMLDWLKSLHPQSHWKPSEEQMKQLYCTITPDSMFV